MTPAEKQRAKDMRSAGSTYREIEAELHYSRKYLWMIVSGNYEAKYLPQKRRKYREDCTRRLAK
jgi:hypothetical protein